MAHFETADLPKTPEVRGPGPAADNPEAPPRKRWWIWGLVVVVAAAGIWYFRTRGIQASNPGGVTATPTRGDLLVLAECAEGIDAFLGKRPPVWTGR